MKAKNTLFVASFAVATLILTLSGCAANKQTKATADIDPSRPTAASIYYYISGSLLHYGADFNSADQLYNLAHEQDRTSLQIRKQLLINLANAYFSGQQDGQKAIDAFNDARQNMSFDADLLNTAYSVYAQAKDSEGQNWALNESIARYPNARAYLQKFYLDYSATGNADSATLDRAIKLSQGNHDNLVLCARMSSLKDLKRSVALLKQAEKLESKPETQKLLSEMSLQLESPNDAKQQFQSFKYPEDKALMLHFLQTANKNKAFDLINSLQEPIIKTSDPSLMGDLAFAAYLRGDETILMNIYSSMQNRQIIPAEDSKIAVFLLAQSLYSATMPKPQVFADMLYSIQDADDLMLYRTLLHGVRTQASSAAEFNPNFFKELGETAKTKLPDTPLSRYLQIVAVADSSSDNALLNARFALCEELVNKGRGYESDWTIVMNRYYQQGRMEDKLSLLRQAIYHFPDNPLFLNDLGYSLLDDPQSLEEAGPLIMRAVSLEPESPYYLDSLAWYYFLTKDYPTALKYIAIPMQMDNMPTEIAYHIGMILLANDNASSAESFLRTVLADTQNPQYQEKAKAALLEAGIQP